MTQTILTTPRTNLIPLTQAQLNLYLNHTVEFSREEGPVSIEILTENLRKAIEMKLIKMKEADPIQHPWITYWLIRIRQDGFGAGMLGFKGAPNLQGEVEIGYGIDPGFRNKGFMTEGVTRLIQWAFEDPRCTRIIAPNTQRSNLSSNRVLEKVGMQIYSESEHTISWCLNKQVECQER